MAAWVKLVKDRVCPTACGSSVVPTNDTASPNVRRMMPARAAAVAWPDTQVGKRPTATGRERARSYAVGGSISRRRTAGAHLGEPATMASLPHAPRLILSAGTR